MSNRHHVVIHSIIFKIGKIQIFRVQMIYKLLFKELIGRTVKDIFLIYIEGQLLLGHSDTEIFKKEAISVGCYVAYILIEPSHEEASAEFIVRSLNSKGFQTIDITCTYFVLNTTLFSELWQVKTHSKACESRNQKPHAVPVGHSLANI